MLYARKTSDGVLVTVEQMVGYREHLVNEHRIVFLTGLITGDVEPHNQLIALDSLSHDPIRLVITSPGGDLDTTFLFYDTIRIIKSPVETLGRYCASAAALLLAVGSKRYLLPHAKVMLHKPWGQREGDSRDWEIQGAEMKKYETGFIASLIECGVKKSYDEILHDIDRNLWLEPEEAIAYGLADKVMEPKDLEGWLE